MTEIFEQVKLCKICSDTFSNTKTKHSPRPVIRGKSTAKILIAGQAPGAKVHESGMPFSDPSGDVLRGWMGLNKEKFFDERNIAIIPMAFCFPGYDANGSDLPPPKICAKTWRSSILDSFKNLELQLLVGSFAQKWHLDTNRSMTDIVQNWRIYSPEILPLPHPSWRNKAWLKKNFWFEKELVPVLRDTVRGILKNETA